MDEVSGLAATQMVQVYYIIRGLSDVLNLIMDPMASSVVLIFG